jgi:thiamine pyrophosphokinase
MKQIKILIAAEKSLLVPVEKLFSFSSIKGETISIYAFNKKTKISSAGLKYKLYKTALPFGVRESTSNVSTNDNVTIKVENGIAFIIRELQSIIKHDLFQSF